MDKSKESISVAYKFTETMREKIGEDVPSWLERALREAFLAGVEWHTSQPAVEAVAKATHCLCPKYTGICMECNERGECTA